MAKKNNAAEAVAANRSFEVEDRGVYRLVLDKFIVPGHNGNQPITAEEALEDPKVLAYLVNAESSAIELETTENQEGE